MTEYFSVLLIAIGIYLIRPLPRLNLQTNTKKRKTKKVSTISVGETRQFIDLLVLTISSGLTTPKAIKESCRLADSQFGTALSEAIAKYDLGANLDAEFRAIGLRDKYWKLVTNLLQQSWEQGSAISENLADLSDYLLDIERAQVLTKVRSAAVKSVLPLGLCFLPAFMIIVVIPIVAGLIPS